MGFRETMEREKHSLLSSKRPYETAAFIIFAILIIQQLFFLIRNLWNFIDIGGNFSTANITVVSNHQVFFNRFVFIDSSKWLYVIVAILLLILYYYLIYRLVWKYCKKHGKAKWTWTLLIVFGPNILFMPPYIFYAIYVFRNYFYKFIKSIVEEYKAFDPKDLAKIDAAIVAQEDAEAKEREEKRETLAIEKLKKEQQKAEQTAIDKENKDKEAEELKLGMEKQNDEKKKIRAIEKDMKKESKEKGKI